MNPLITAGLGGIIETVGNVADDLFTSDEERAKGELDAYKAESDRMRGQVETNKIEAASSSFWVSGWRPAIGWVCAATLAMAYIPKAIVLTVVWCFAAYESIKAGAGIPQYPEFGLADILGLLFSLLGVGTMRTIEKLKDKAS